MSDNKDLGAEAESEGRTLLRAKRRLSEAGFSPGRDEYHRELRLIAALLRGAKAKAKAKSGTGRR